MRRTWTSMIVAAALIAPTAAPAAGLEPNQNWTALTEALKAAGERISTQLPQGLTQQDLSDMDLMKLGGLMSGYLMMAQGDVDHPSFVPRLSLFENYLVPNTDTRYLGTVIDGRGVYRLRGERGTVPLIDLAVRSPYVLDIHNVTVTYQDYDFDSLKLDRDGRFDVTLSAERPKGYTGDWWYLDPRAASLSLRIVSDDWGKQVDPRVTIQRIDVPARKPRPTAEEIYRRIALIPAYMEIAAGVWLKHAEGLEKAGWVNKIQILSEVPGRLTGQEYYETIYDFAPDEALIVETSVPKTCRYWSILLADMLGGSLDWSNNQASLNRHSARLDSDGKFRAVLAHVDPGVPNWLDTAGHAKGVIQGRWTFCDSVPVPNVRKIKLTDLRTYLPPDTPRVSPSEREVSLRLRREAEQLRRQW